jgi:hypothetical protein
LHTGSVTTTAKRFLVPQKDTRAKVAWKKPERRGESTRKKFDSEKYIEQNLLDTGGLYRACMNLDW